MSKNIVKPMYTEEPITCTNHQKNRSYANFACEAFGCPTWESAAAGFFRPLLRLVESSVPVYVLVNDRLDISFRNKAL